MPVGTEHRGGRARIGGSDRPAGKEGAAARLPPNGRREVGAVLDIRPRRPHGLVQFLVPAISLALALASLAMVPSVSRATSPGLFITALSGQAVAGSPYSFLVWMGVAGSRYSCFADKVHFTDTDPGAGLPADYRFIESGYFIDECFGGDAQGHTFTFTPATAGIQTVTVSDLDDPSILSGTLTLNVVAGAATRMMVSNLASPVDQGAGTSFRLTVADYYWNVATGYTGTVTFTSDDPSAQLPPPYTFTAGDAGTRLFTVAFGSIGTDMVTAYDNAHGLVASVSTNVVQQVHFYVVCSDSSAGYETSCTVIAEKNGSIDKGYTGTIHFASSDPLAVLPANYYINAGVQGEPPPFPVTFKTAGAQTFDVTDVANPTIMGTTTANIIGGDTVGVSVVGLPSSMVAGSVSIIVKTRDAFGNWGASGTLSFSSTDPRAVLPSPFTFHGIDYGTHAFTVTMKSPGQQTLTATAVNWLGSFPGSASTMTYKGNATRFVVSGIPNPAITGTGWAFSVRATDAYDNTDTDYRGTVHFWSSDPDASLPSDYFLRAADGGSHSFVVTFAHDGSQTVCATDMLTGSITGCQTVTVNYPPTSYLGVSGISSPAVAGVWQPVTITARAATGAVAIGYRGTVHFTSSDVAALLPNNYTFSAADAGVHTFAFSLPGHSRGVLLRTAGPQSVTATDAEFSSITGMQAGISVVAGGAATFAVSGLPSSTSVKVPRTLTVSAKDCCGNTATGYRGSVHFTSSDPLAVLPADYGFLAADAGIRSFSVTFKTAGSQSVTVTDTGNAAITGSQGGVTVTADTTPPTASPPTASLVKGGKLTSTTSVKISWPAASDPSGISRYDLKRQTNGGAWSTISLTSPTATSATVALSPGSATYAFEVRATDGAGNIGAWVTGNAFKLMLAQENASAVTYTGAFTRTTLTGASGGYVKYASAAGRVAKFTFTGRSVAFVGTKGPDRGKAEIWLDGAKLATIDCYAASRGAAAVLYAVSVTGTGTHTLQVRVLGTKNANSSSKRVDIDAFLAIR